MARSLLLEVVQRVDQPADVPYNPQEHSRLVVHVTKALETRIRAYQRRQQMVTLSETLRRLLTVGLEAEERREREAKPRK